MSARCPVCCSDRVELYCRIPCSVSSNGRPLQFSSETLFCTTCQNGFKLRTEQDHYRIEELYNSLDYVLHDVNGYHETKVGFAKTSQGIPKSKYILEQLESIIKIEPTGNLLDIGCHFGSFLRYFHKKFPNWTLWGQDVSSRYRDHVDAISSSTHYISSIGQAPMGVMSLVSISHVLEHVPSPKDTVQACWRSLKPGGKLTLQINNFKKHMFQPLIYEQHYNFTAPGVQSLLSKVGFEVIAVDENGMDKEICIVAQKPLNKKDVHLLDIHNTVNDVQQNARLIQNSIAQIQQIKSRVAILGSSIAAIWTAQLIPPSHLFGLVDEDSDRIGKEIHRFKVYSLEQIPKNLPILLPFPKEQAENIKTRLSKKNDRPFIVPPYCF